jgi:hypothetical protein
MPRKFRTLLGYTRIWSLSGSNLKYLGTHRRRCPKSLGEMLVLPKKINE